MIDQKEYFENIATYKLLAKHEVGQNFLIDEDVSEKIVALLNVKEEDHVLEIGSGAGSLSYFLAKTPGKIEMIDIDEGLITKLQNDFAGLKNIHPVIGNAMRYDMEKFTKIIGNLPYYITSGILERVLLNAKNATKAVFMVQKEALSRLSATKGSKDYGPLPILIQYRAKMTRLFNVNRMSFAPAPHIDSSVFSLDFYDGKDLKTTKELYSLLNGVFLHRRKTILNNLTSFVKDSSKARNILAKANVNELLRPEDISLEQYLSILSCL